MAFGKPRGRAHPKAAPSSGGAGTASSGLAVQLRQGIKLPPDRLGMLKEGYQKGLEFFETFNDASNYQTRIIAAVRNEDSEAIRLRLWHNYLLAGVQFLTLGWIVLDDLKLGQCWGKILVGQNLVPTEGQKMPRKQGDLRICIKSRGGKTHRIESIRQAFGQRFWVPR